MNTYKKEVTGKVCYTELGYQRINNKLGLELSNDKIEHLISELISITDESKFKKIGKNIYVINNEKNIRLTINSSTYRIITVDKLHKLHKLPNSRNSGSP